MATIKSLGDNNKAYSLAQGEEVDVQDLFGIPAGQEQIILVCAGPNAVYYHTEGNPPGFGDNDNGDISPNKSSTFKITAATVFVPSVYLHAKHGPTMVGVFLGPVRLFGNILDIPTAVQKIIDLFK